MENNIIHNQNHFKSSKNLEDLKRDLKRVLNNIEESSELNKVQFFDNNNDLISFLIKKLVVFGNGLEEFETMHIEQLVDYCFYLERKIQILQENKQIND